MHACARDNLTRVRWARRGLTLLELLVVVFILSALALSTVSIVEQADEQDRYEETARRLAQIRRAIVGEPLAISANQRLLSGFAVDVGKIPERLQQLLDGAGLQSHGAQRPRFDPTPDEEGFDDGSGDEIELSSAAHLLLKGYRGPYLNGGLSSGRYRDGWGNRGRTDADDRENHGWMITGLPGEFRITSRGTDDINALAAYQAAMVGGVFASDWRVELGGWRVDVVNASGRDIDYTGHELRARLLVYVDGKWKQMRCEGGIRGPLPSSTGQPQQVGSITFSASVGWVPIGEHLLVLECDPPLAGGDPLDVDPNRAEGQVIAERVRFFPKATLPRIALVIR